MPECPRCLGEGGHDMRELDAHLEEHLTPAALRWAKAGREQNWKGWIECDECEGTGVVSAPRRRLLEGEAASFVAQVKAKIEEKMRNDEST